MSTAFAENALSGENGYVCKGNHPHLPKNNSNQCSATMKTKLRSSSSMYFPVIVSALSIPPWSKDAVLSVQKKYNDTLEYITDKSKLIQCLESVVLPHCKKPITLADLLEAYNLIKNNRANDIIRTDKDIYYDEYKVLCRGTIDADEEYSAYEVDCPELFKQYFDTVVSVDKLTVVQALCGFTRLKPWSGGDLKDPHIVPLSSTPKDFYPATKLKGEGIFIKFNSDKLKEWKERIGNRYERMRKALEVSYDTNPRFSENYVFLHTFSHLLIREVSHICGYNSSSIKEKIYSTFNDDDKEMNGVLIYLASSDCDGSLGGLIEVAKNEDLLDNILQSMLNRALWCSGDPLCANSMQQGRNSLNYSACHDCTLLPETSCEFKNLLLDRVSVIGLEESRESGFFRDIIEEIE